MIVYMKIEDVNSHIGVLFMLFIDTSYSHGKRFVLVHKLVLVQNQSAFLPMRFILDNILLTHDKVYNHKL
jgi:hypothetical protein